MSGASSSVAAWSTWLEPVLPPDLPRRADDPRLGEAVEFRPGSDAPALTPGRPVLLGFPQDEGVRRNHGRPGAAEAPAAVRRELYRLTPWDAAGGADLAGPRPLDLGDVRLTGDLEATQAALAEVVAAVLAAGAVPIVLGGGHETAYGHYLGYVQAGRPVGVLNLDAHLDVRPCLDGEGHSGSPFRQALEHPTHPLPGDRYVCLGAQPHSVSREHLDFARRRGAVVRWADEVHGRLNQHFARQCDRLVTGGCPVYVTLDADVAALADVPGVSAPNPLGLPGAEVIACARLAGATPGVASFDLVEINPRLDRDAQSARWAALAIWHFLAGLAGRSAPSTAPGQI
jgi:formiminoglutamase